MSKDNPFYSGTHDGCDCFYITADDRVKRVAEFDLQTCRRALELAELQATVRGALERRVRKLERAAKP